MKRKDFFRAAVGTIAAVSVPGFIGRESSAGQTTVTWPTVDPDDERFWKFVKGQFPLTEERAYMNTGGLGASPYEVIDAVKAKMDELERVAETGYSEPVLKEIKTAASQLLGCNAEELAFTRNATEGINIVCNGLPLKSGDEVITTTHEHVGNAVPWLGLRQRTGIVIKLFEPSVQSAEENVDRIEKLITARTRLISIPHATTTTGQVLPVKAISELAKRKNIWLFVDGAQTAGMLSFSLHDLGCDAYATSGHKWMLGPKETGLLYVRKDMLDTLQAKFIGAYSDNGYDLAKGTLALHPTARRYEHGTINIPIRVGLGAAIKFLQRIGMENVWHRDQALSNRLFDGLKEIPYVQVLSPATQSERSALITFKHEKIAFPEVQNHLNTQNLRTRGVGEGGVNGIRISTHIYNTHEEVERVLEAVRTVWKG